MKRAAAILALALAAPSAAAAQCDAGEELSVGVVAARCEGDGLRWAVLTADLAASDVGVRASRPAERGVPIETWSGSIEGAVAAIPGGAFRFVDFAPAGLTVGEGEPWPGTADDPTRAVLALDAAGAGLVVQAEQVVPPEAWMSDVVSGAPVVRAGVPVECRGDGCEPAPRTGVGLSEDGRVLIAVSVEGWSLDSAGVTDAELGGLLRDAGAHDAIRVADGATSVMWTRPGGAIVPSSDGASRAGAAFLAVIDRSMGATGQLVGVVERMGDGAPLPSAHLRVKTTDGRLVAEADPMTAGGYFTFTLPARDYVLEASLDGYRTACRVCRVEAGGEKWCSVFLATGDGADRCMAPPRGIDAGPWPVGDAGRPVVDASVVEPPGGGCAVARTGRDATWLGIPFLLAVARLSRRRRGKSTPSLP